MTSESGTLERTRVQAVVIGAGVAGAAIAYEFACYGVQTLVLEQANGPAAGMSGASAGVLHAGADAPPDAPETSLILAGANRWPLIFEELKISYKVCGSVLIAQDSSQLALLAQAEQTAAANGIKVRSYDRGQIRNLEPQAKAVGGLLVPQEAITDPYEMVNRLLSTGATLRYGSRVTAVEPGAGGALVRCTSGDVEAQFVINCAGPGAADVAGDDALTIDTERGDFVVFGEEATILTDHVIRAVPAGGVSPMIFPTIHGRLGAAVASPSSAAGGEDSRAAWTAALQSQAAKLVPKLTGFTPEDGWSCDDAVGKGRTLIAEWSKRIPAMYNVASLGRSGLTLALGLSAYVLDRCRERGLAVQARTARTGRGQEPAFPWWQRRRR